MLIKKDHHLYMHNTKKPGMKFLTPTSSKILDTIERKIENLLENLSNINRDHLRNLEVITSIIMTLPVHTRIEALKSPGCPIDREENRDLDREVDRHLDLQVDHERGKNQEDHDLE